MSCPAFCFFLVVGLPGTFLMVRRTLAASISYRLRSRWRVHCARSHACLTGCRGCLGTWQCRNLASVWRRLSYG
ncbi:hypothetical protein PF005_g2437 [Phytophthora fragariae]|uniref:Uncharacterized protein n=1 Tax=Phytophthora fragariae TaxID=53985 RepID=A0A6A3M4F7_9STRA|nr:hypothetical protein PF003_g8529 [Phytophthora fragariae]KAE8946073.1 hypothetical protein PF009_g4297 [Phytophthora fragariae]KAE9025110.1 hypothetical protein PF011_g3186 [Phytophthora fragariae]KAE9135617.1 hypothetical protein PF010_g2019 [Phytophthora fragariae]KAE9135934.1 hypothetical protein PF007_g2382 [Phytophthora fragariae]